MDRPEPGDVLEGKVLVVDIGTFVVLSEVRALKQASGYCHFILADGATVASREKCAADWAPILARILADRDTDG